MYIRLQVVIVPNARSDTLIPIIGEKIRPASIVYSDTFKSDDVFDVSALDHLRINHSNLFADYRNHINGIENFWNQAKRRLTGYNGIPRQYFYLFIKKCEWWFT
jgi:transposase